MACQAAFAARDGCSLPSRIAASGSEISGTHAVSLPGPDPALSKHNVRSSQLIVHASASIFTGALSAGLAHIPSADGGGLRAARLQLFFRERPPESHCMGCSACFCWLLRPHTGANCKARSAILLGVAFHTFIHSWGRPGA